MAAEVSHRLLLAHGDDAMAAEALAAAQADAERLSDGRSRRGVLGRVQAGVESLTGSRRR
ncbi:MAG: hypothetical protein U0Q12_03045 [Vicinamibacterales bacterium]